MAARKGCCGGGCLLKSVIALVIIIAIIGGAIIWAVNQTPERFGLADYEINGMTLRQLGIADTKIKDILKAVKALFKPDEKSILNNPYDPDTDGPSADAKAANAGLPEKNGAPDYLSLVGDEPLTTSAPALLSFRDTELAYLLDSIVSQGAEQVEEEAQQIKDMNASVAQVTISKGDSVTLEILLKINISPIKSQLPGIVAGRITDNIYLNSRNKLTVDENGMISTESINIIINGMNSAISDLLVGSLAGNLSEEENGAENPAARLNDLFGAFFQKVVNNIGLVGTAELDGGGNVNVSSIAYGPAGVTAHTIKLITRTEAEE